MSRSCHSFLKLDNPASFCLFPFFSYTNFTEKTVGFSGIRTRIVRVEGKHADHLTTTTARKRFSLMTCCCHHLQMNYCCVCKKLSNKNVFSFKCSIFDFRLWLFQSEVIFSETVSQIRETECP